MEWIRMSLRGIIAKYHITLKHVQELTAELKKRKYSLDWIKWMPKPDLADLVAGLHTDIGARDICVWSF